VRSGIRESSALQRLSFPAALALVAIALACGTSTDGASSTTTPSSNLNVPCTIDPATGLATCDGGVVDAGPDGGRDGGPPDGGRDGGPDGGPPDGGRDGGPDGGPPDGGRDGGPPDGGPDAGPDGGICDAAPAGFFLAGAVPDDCKWNIPKDTRDIFPVNFIFDLEVVNIVGKIQETDTRTYGRCSSDRKINDTGSIQACVRPAANPVGWCFAGSYGSIKEDGQCNTPFCACEGDNGQCVEPHCTLHIDNKQFGAGGGVNIRGPAGNSIPFIGKYIPYSNKYNINANLIAQVGAGFGTDTRNGSSPCFNCCANGNPKRDNTKHINFELKGTVFATARIWNLCATLTVNAGYCFQKDFIDRLQCDGAAVSLDKNLNYVFASLGNIYIGACTGDGDKKKNARGGICAYDTTSNTLRCGIGWLSVKLPIPADVSFDFGSGATSDICLF
jgi:hypothetical protein